MPRQRQRERDIDRKSERETDRQTNRNREIQSETEKQFNNLRHPKHELALKKKLVSLTTNVTRREKMNLRRKVVCFFASNQNYQYQIWK